MPKKRSSGGVYDRPGTKLWWLHCSLYGKTYRKSSGTANKAKAKDMLADWLEELGVSRKTGKPLVTPKMRKRTVGELLDGLALDYQVRHVASPQVRSHVKTIREHFAHYYAVEVSREMIQHYIGERQKVVSDTTINRETQLLKQAFKLGRIPDPPEFTRLPEHNARHGEFSSQEFNRVVALLPNYLQNFVAWAYYTGWRAGSIKSLRWQEIAQDTLLCRAQYSKNREVNRIPLVGPLREIIARCRDHRKGDFVFHYPDGRPIGSYRTAWGTALKRAELTGKIFHDFRRTAASNLRRAGVAESVIMQIGGWKTRSMFSRYSISNDRDVRKALETREQFEHELQATAEQVTPVLVTPVLVTPVPVLSTAVQ